MRYALDYVLLLNYAYKTLLQFKTVLLTVFQVRFFHQRPVLLAASLALRVLPHFQLAIVFNVLKDLPKYRIRVQYAQLSVKRAQAALRTARAVIS